MTYWPNPQDQEAPCRSCGMQTSVFNKGYCSTQCENDSWDKTIVEETKKPKYNFEDVVRGRDTDNTSQEYFMKKQIKQKIAKAEMLGFKGDADRIREQHKVLLSK